MCSLLNEIHPIDNWSKVQCESNTTSKEKSWTKLNLLEELATIETGLQNSLALRPSKNTTNKLGLVRELKGLLVVRPDDLRIPFDIQGGIRAVDTTCRRRFSCVKQDVDGTVLLEHKLAEALAFLNSQEHGFDKEDVCETDSVSCESSHETEADNEVDVTVEDKKISVQSDANEPESICMSRKQICAKSDPEGPISSSLKERRCTSGGILVNNSGDKKVNRDGYTADTTRKKHNRRVSFHSNDTVRHIEKELTVEDKLTEARKLILLARMSKEKIGGPVTAA